ncbi:prepilin peptidase [Neptuniibacter halophilus]|uniref:prepilin peptidase n=1 Tax=Neptuniibacter halophilus TaxID=651666 RepID=UPI0025722761|nr:A24 family peptidase [Neptuniibacter halophilus]
MPLLITDPLWAAGLIFLLSLCVGSFLNVVIHRLPIIMEREWALMCSPEQPLTPATYNLSLPASSCPGCGHKIRWYENIPLLSYAWLRGRCSGCRTPISLRYPFVELLTGCSSAYVVYLFGLNPAGLTLVLLTWGLICLLFIDLDHQLLPDRITLPLLWLGLLANSFNLFTSLENAVYGAMAGYLTLWGVYWAFKLLTGKEGMGYGDFKLLAALGAWAGIGQLPFIILMSSLVGAIFGIGMMLLRNHQSQTPIPFGPYLAIAGWIALLWGDHITSLYLQFLAV